MHTCPRCGEETKKTILCRKCAIHFYHEKYHDEVQKKLRANRIYFGNSKKKITLAAAWPTLLKGK
jgi:hypothetical protein